jgi:hypothetical protein
MHTTAETAGAKTGRPSRRYVKIASLIVVPVAVFVSGLLVSHASSSTHSDSTVTTTNHGATGTLTLGPTGQALNT